MAGIKLSSTTSYSTEHSSGSGKWSEVKLQNYVPVEIEQIPNLNINMGVFGTSLYYNANYRMTWFTNADLKYSLNRNANNNRQVRNCLNLGTEVKQLTGVPNEASWRGRSYDLEDGIIGYKEL